MSIKLYGLGPSRSFRCLWALCETNLDFDYIAVAFDQNAENSTKSADYLSKNSQGKVPTLEHNDFVLTESLAIVNYINSLTTDEFIPTDSQTRAQYDELTSFIVTELEQALWTNGKHRFALPEEQRVKEIFPTAEFEFAKAIDTLDKLVKVDGFVLNDTFTFADIMLAQTINWAERFEFEVPEQYINYRNRMYRRAGTARAVELIN